MLSDQYQITDQPTSLMHVYLEKGNRTETPHSTSPNVENLQQTPRVTLQCGGLKEIGGWQVLFVLIFTLFLRTANFLTRLRMRKNFPMVDLQKNIQSFNTSGLKILFRPVLVQGNVLQVLEITKRIVPKNLSSELSITTAQIFWLITSFCLALHSVLQIDYFSP